MIEFPDKKYKIIYADPPWSYENKTLGRQLDAGSADHYDVMSLNEIKSLPINQIRNKNCVLFMWAVVPQLPEAFEVMKAWGFKYKTTITWHKLPGNRTQAGMGYWFRGYTEHLLFGVCGNVLAFHSQKKNIITQSILGHSKKPDSFRKLIESATKNIQPRIELFARMKIPGWTCVGKEIDEQDIKISLTQISNGTYHPKSLKEQPLECYF